jgi:hypothetical protein
MNDRESPDIVDLRHSAVRCPSGLPGPHGDESVDVTEPTCVMCAAPVADPDVCCSLQCAELAQRELGRNVARIRSPRAVRDPELRERLTARNGQLSAALIRWRPSAASVPGIVSPA